jgi:hypothetical protein
VCAEHSLFFALSVDCIIGRFFAAGSAYTKNGQPDRNLPRVNFLQTIIA